MKIPQGTGQEFRERDAPQCLPWRYQGRTGVRGLRHTAPARAPRGTLSMWARAPRASRSLCGRGPCERCSTGTTLLPSSQLRSSAPKTGRTESSGPSGPVLRNRAGRMGGGTTGDEDLRSRGLWYGWDQNSLGIGRHSTPFRWMTLGNVSQQGKKCSRSWEAHTLA